MKYYKNTSEQYLTSLSTGLGQIEISKGEYDTIMEALHNRPSAPDGYAYRLKTDLTWALYKLPPEPEEDAEPEDYEAALRELGVNV